MYTRRTFTAALGAVGAALTAPGLFSARAAAAETKAIRIGWQKNGVLALAKSQGALEQHFKDQGIEITWSEFSSGPPLLEALGAGALDFGPTGDVPRSLRRPPEATYFMSVPIPARRLAPQSSSTRMRPSRAFPT